MGIKGGENIRIGDYDALNARIDKCVGIDGLGLEPVMAIRDIKALISVMPTIPAIPVEWMEKKRENLVLAAMVHSTVYGDNSIELCHAVNVVLDMWQKEQEAR